VTALGKRAAAAEAAGRGAEARALRQTAAEVEAGGTVVAPPAGSASPPTVRP